MSIADIIDQMNEMAEAILDFRRAHSAPHRFGIWRGEPNPYSVGNPGRSDAWDW